MEEDTENLRENDFSRGLRQKTRFPGVQKGTL